MLAALLAGAVIPPAAGRPFCSRLARQTLYLVNGKRSLTSSIDMSFFSRRRRRPGGAAPISMPAASCSRRAWRERLLYRKQYLMPTMILGLLSARSHETGAVEGSGPKIGKHDAETESDEEEEALAATAAVIIAAARRAGRRGRWRGGRRRRLSRRRGGRRRSHAVYDDCRKKNGQLATSARRKRLSNSRHGEGRRRRAR